jgi:hypothetical protein
VGSLFESLNAQGYNIGIRAGISQSMFSGPTEANVNESFALNNGFHFGINFQWNFNDVVGIRSEILYNQTGSDYEFRSPDGYYLFDLVNNDRFVLRDNTEIQLSHSNAYISFPQTFHFSVGERFEVFAGGYVGLMINPVATGTFTFGGDPNIIEHSFIQGLDYDYNSNRAGQSNFFAQPILIRVIGEDVDLPGIVGAYYLYEEVEDDLFAGVDYGSIAGFSYYFNRGLYAMLRVEYGLKDITRNNTDISRQDVNDDGSFVYRDDFDRNLGFFLSIGFRF